MSSKTVGIIVVIVILGIGLWLMMKNGNEGYSNTMVPTSTQSEEANTVASDDTSDSALSQDAAMIDAQINGLDADTEAAASAE